MSFKKFDTNNLTLAAFLVLIPIGYAFSAWVWMLLWNSVLIWLFPALPVIDFWKSIGIVLILQIVGGFFNK